MSLTYSERVEHRRQCVLCNHLGLTNPRQCEDGVYDKEDFIGPWTRWQDNPTSELMVVGQDWGGTKYYIKHKAMDEDDNPTNINLAKLLESVGKKIPLPRQTMPKDRILFFTNAVLCLRSGKGLTGGTVSPCCYTNCATEFLRPQVEELVKPRVVVSLGLQAFRSLVKVFGRPEEEKKTKRLMKLKMLEAVTDVNHHELTKYIWLVPVYHPGKQGSLSRTYDEQLADWKRVRKALDEPRTE